MTDSSMAPRDLLEALLELANRAQLEVRVLSAAGRGRPGELSESATCRVGERIWVVLAPDDPPTHQASIVAEALTRFRPSFLEDTFIAPGVRDYLEGAAARRGRS